MLFALDALSVNQAKVVPSSIVKQRNRETTLESRADLVLLLVVIFMTSFGYFFAGMCCGVVLRPYGNAIEGDLFLRFDP